MFDGSLTPATHTPAPLFLVRYLSFSLREGEVEDQLDEEDEGGVSSDDEAGSGSGVSDDDDDSDDEDGSTSSSEVDSVFGSDLDGGDEDLGEMRKSAGLRGSAARYERSGERAS